MQKITTPNGETLILLPLEEYERLIDAADVAVADRVKANVAAGLDEMVPAELVKRLLAGENPLRVWRAHRGMSARELAAKAGLSASYLSEIECGRKEGSASVLRTLASLLAVQIEDLLAEPVSRDRAHPAASEVPQAERGK